MRPHLCRHGSGALRGAHGVHVEKALQAVACVGTVVLLAGHLLLLPAQLLLQLQLHLQRLQRGHPLHTISFNLASSCKAGLCIQQNGRATNKAGQEV